MMGTIATTSRRRRRGAGGIEEIGIIMLFLLVIILGTVQLGLFLHDQMRVERLTGSVAHFMTAMDPATPPTSAQEASLEKLLVRSAGLESDDYGLRVRQIQIDADPPGARVMWTRTYGTMQPPDALAAEQLASSEATDDEVMVVVEMTGRIRGASALFESAAIGQARRMLHSDTQPAYDYARLDSGLASPKLLLDGDLRGARDSDDSTASVYADQSVSTGRRYIEAEVRAGDELHLGWQGAPTPSNFNRRLARQGYGLRAFARTGQIEVYDPGLSSFVQVASTFSHGDRVGIGLDAATGEVIVRTDVDGTCKTVYTGVHGTPSLPARAGMSLVNRGTAPRNDVRLAFGEHGFRCKPPGYEGVRTMN